MRRPAGAAWIMWGVLLVALASCSRCGQSRSGREPKVVERVLGRGAVAVVVVPQLSSLGQKIERFERLKVAAFLAPTQGFESPRALIDALVAELGVDVRSPAALDAFGLEGEAPMGVGVQVTGHAYLALPVKDASRLHASLAKLAGGRLGAPVGGEQTVDGTVVKTFSSEARSSGAKGPPRLGYALAHGFALVAVDQGISGLAALAGLPQGDSLAKEPALEAAHLRVGSAGDAFVYLPPGSPLLGQWPLESALVVVTLEPTAFVARLDAPWRSGAPYRALLEPHDAAVELASSLPSDAFLVAHYDGPPRALGLLWRELLGRRVESVGFDLEGEILAHLEPGVVGALSLAERPPLGRGLPTLDVRSTNPFSYVGLTGIAALDGADAGVLARALEKAASLAPRLGAEMNRADRAGATAYLSSWAQGEGVHFAVRGDRTYFASPVERLDQLLAAKGESGATGRRKAGPALSVVLDLSKFAQSVRALPESVWGLGGFAMKGTAVRWLDAVDDVKALTLEVSSKGQVVEARLALSLAPTPSKSVP